MSGLATSPRTILDELRAADALRFPAVLFVPQDHRAAIAALWGFHAETRAIPDRVSEPAPGEIRLQWWRDIVLGERSGEAAASPLAGALLAAISAHSLPIAGFERYLEARIFDLYHDPMPDRTALETWAGETESFIFQMAAQVLGAPADSTTADASGHAGVAAATASLLRSLAVDRRAGRGHVPEELLRACGLSRSEWLCDPSSVAGGLGSSEPHLAVVAGMAALAREHLEKASTAIASLPRNVQAAYLPLCLVRPTLKVAERKPSALFEAPLTFNPLRIQLAYWRAALAGI